MPDLFDDDAEPDATALAEGAALLRGRALPVVDELLAAVGAVAAAAPFRRMLTPGGFEMSVAMTNCGTAGWVSDRKGYRYAPADPLTGAPWPTLPACFLRLAGDAAAEAGYPGFVPDACLVNRYAPGARLSLHQDRDERDYGHPIVSVSLGLPATFQFGGPRRADPVRKLALRHGDVVVWGGVSRLHHHGVLALKDGEHPATGRARINLTLRKAL
jgi:alkylated DNA repair protein (DNA oxidative demethylase)